MRRQCLTLFVALLLLAAGTAELLAWGPHPTITQAALDALGPDDALIKQLGPYAARLTDYCWMGDMRRQLKTNKLEQYYADDYLLYPGMPKHLDHLCPTVKGTYTPHFKRALQALRTETPLNAARWIGAVLHFVEDTGSPPHAAEISGDVHSKMENWVDAKQILLGAYKPQLLGQTDDAALEGFLKRMDGLIAFSKERGLRLSPLVKLGQREAVEPVVLESALETSRVVADLLHTLGQRALELPQDGAALTGKVTSTNLPKLERVPAKLILEGTLYSTLADESGAYSFHHLPPGKYSLCVLRAGHALFRAALELRAGQTLTQDVALQPAAAATLLRNGDFQLRWVQAAVPDAWYPGSAKLWQSDFIPVAASTKYKLKAAWLPDAKGQIEVKFAASPTPNDINQSKESVKLLAGETERIMDWQDRAGFVQIFIQADDGSPEKVCSGVTFAPVE